MDEVTVPRTTAYCGLNCATCPIYVATRESDPATQMAQRKQIAGMINAHYGIDLSAGQINDCDGCRSDSGRLFSLCGDCEIRRCAAEKRVESCAFCPGYVCEKLHEFIQSE
ncbi:MAG: DUF3795 domain-containing protein [Bacteroidetes bacterium]|nr:DUF3795 domain-containing protein [Bacteroidota bacterium]